nr:MAG: replication associated protein [Cressdnaviricota sp.]
MSFKARNFCLTLNNYIENDVEQLLEFFRSKKNCKYIIGREVAPTTGTKHLQIYCSFVNPISLNTLKNMKLSNKAHIEKAKGNQNQNFKYCSKEGTFVTNMENIEQARAEYFTRWEHENHWSIQEKALYEKYSHLIGMDEGTVIRWERMRKHLEDTCAMCREDYTSDEYFRLI